MISNFHNINITKSVHVCVRELLSSEVGSVVGISCSLATSGDSSWEERGLSTVDATTSWCVPHQTHFLHERERVCVCVCYGD